MTAAGDGATVKASDLMVRCLENEEVRYIFGVPGDYSENLKLSERPKNMICPAFPAP